ncbi:hypothetical protein NFI96_008515, partial [Prochilodus magdalenae]
MHLYSPIMQLYSTGVLILLLSTGKFLLWILRPSHQQLVSLHNKAPILNTEPGFLAIDGGSSFMNPLQGSDSAVPQAVVELHHPATLPCSERCPGVVRWTVFSNSTDVLAECDQTSCRSVKEGYQMIHDQYLKGNFSLTITDADLSKRAGYTSRCDGEDLCDVELQTEPIQYSKHDVSPRPHFLFKIHGSRLFSVLAPRWRNELPLGVRTAESLAAFKRRLKTHLLEMHFSISAGLGLP